MSGFCGQLSNDNIDGTLGTRRIVRLTSDHDQEKLGDRPFLSVRPADL